MLGVFAPAPASLTSLPLLGGVQITLATITITIGAPHPGDHHDCHLCVLLPDDGPHRWWPWCFPHAFLQPVDLPSSSSWSPCGRVPPLASHSCYSCCCLDCTVHWAWCL